MNAISFAVGHTMTPSPSLWFRPSGEDDGETQYDSQVVKTEKLGDPCSDSSKI